MARIAALGALVSIALIAAACSSEGVGVSTERSDDNTGAAVDDSDVAQLAWKPCEETWSAVVVLDCAMLSVPLDYDAPDGEQIEIAVARSAAIGVAEDRIGSLVFNPGGPGGSGIESLGFLPLTMSSDILERFDLVSFDPRGVGASTALNCATDVDDDVTLLAVGDDAGWAALLADGKAQHASCDAATLDLAPFVGTNNAARDMDRLRVALGDPGLTYVGYSYGTRLGATYAELFPDNVRALVLDAGVKPSSDSGELDKDQGGGFDRALENFAAACDADSDCLLNDVGPTLDVIDGLEAEIAQLGSFPTDDPDRVLTPGELSLGIAAALYSKESWPFLASALFTAEAEQDGTLLQVLGDSLAGRQPDGTYDNSNVANGFINCADDPARPAADDQRAAADAAAERSTHFADFLRASTGCIGVTPAVDPLVIGPAEGAAPIVVIGNSGDPATPYEWSVELADSLDSAVLYTVEAEGHTAYGSIECVQAEIDAYLIELAVPAEGASCSDNASADFFLPEGESDLGQILVFFDCVRDEGADIPEFSEADILADPTLDTVFGDLDLTDADLQGAFLACSALLPEL